jgi:hypothetical protein
VQLRQRSVEDMILDWTVGQSKPIESYRVLSQTDLGPNAVTLFEQCQSVDGLVREASILLHKDENGNWRRMMAAEEMPKLEAMIRRLATQPGSEAHSIGHKSLEASSLESSKKR